MTYIHRYHDIGVCIIYVGTERMKRLLEAPASAAAAPLANGKKPKNALSEFSAQGGRASTANASREAVARARTDFLECSVIGCHKSVAPSRQRRNATTCGNKACYKAC